MSNAYQLNTHLPLLRFGSCDAPEEPGEAWLKAENGRLVVCAEFTDSDIFNRARKNNEFTWETGDAMEFFFQMKGHEDYYELHVTPEEYTLQLHIQNYRTHRSVPWEEKLCELHPDASAQVCREQNKWYPRIAVDFSAIGLTANDLCGSRFAVCRYNYNAKWAKPELSGTGHFTETFHCPPLWNVIAREV